MFYNINISKKLENRESFFYKARVLNNYCIFSKPGIDFISSFDDWFCVDSWVVVNFKFVVCGIICQFNVLVVKISFDHKTRSGQ